MTTFSQLVDRLLVEHIRPDLLANIAGYLNQTIREAHIKSSTDSQPVFYDENRVEAQLTVSGYGQGPITWEIPNTSIFQAMEAVFYRSCNVYAKYRKPSVARLRLNSQVNDQFYYYRAGNYIVLNEPGYDGQLVDISYFNFLASLNYQPAVTRVISYDANSDTYVLTPYGVSIGADYDASLARATNWMIQRHEETLAEGIRAKVFKRLGDLDRAKLSFSTFESMRAGIINTGANSYGESYAR